MPPIPARSCQRAISTITDARASRQARRTPRALSAISPLDLVGAAASLLAFAYLCDVASLQTRLILLLQEWSSLLRSGNDAIVSMTVAVAPFLVGGAFLALCPRLLGRSTVTRRFPR